MGGLHLVRNFEPPKREIPVSEMRRDHDRVVDEYERSKKLRGHVENTLRESRKRLTNFFIAAGKFAWEVTTEDVKAYLESLVDLGLAVSTRRQYVGEIKLFYDFLLSHPVIPPDPLLAQLGNHAERIDGKYGIRVQQPVDTWFLPVHKTDDVPQDAIPSKDQLRSFFVWLRKYDAHKPWAAARDYAVFRLFYHTGLRANEVAHLDLKDLRFDLGTIHCRFGKGTKGSGPRERYVPLRWGGLDKVLRVYLKEVRPRFRGADDSNALFLSEHGGPLAYHTIRTKLTGYIDTARKDGIDTPYFSCHDLRRAFATHLYEEHPDKIEVIRQILGHWNLATTQKYLRPSATFIEQQFESLTNQRLAILQGGDDND